MKSTNPSAVLLRGRVFIVLVMSKTISRKSMHKAVGPCPICGKANPWLNDIPLTAFCWGTDDKPHVELRRVVPSPFQIYGEVGSTEWRKANGHKVKTA